MRNLDSTLKTLAFIVLVIISNNLSSQISAPKCATFEEQVESFNTRGSGKTSIKPILRLLMNTSAFDDETVFYFEQGGTPAFQPAFDAYKLIFNAGYPYLGSMSDSILTSISGLPELTVNTSVPVKAITPSNGTFTFSSQKTDFPDNVCVTLYDALTGISTNILSNDYICTLYATTSNARFTMNFFTTPSLGISQLEQPKCISQGMIRAKGSGAGPWNYEWKRGNAVIKTSLNKTSTDSLENLNGGTYSVKISSVGHCDNFSKTFIIDSIANSFASFTPSTFTTSLSKSGQVIFSNTSSGAQFSTWDFGDNSGTWYIPSPSHNYVSAGNYTVTLIIESIDHCKATAQQVINILDDVTGIPSLAKNLEVRMCSLSQGNYELRFLLSEATTVEIELLNLEGKLIKADILTNVSSFNYAVNLDRISSGMYLLKLRTEGSQKTFKLFN